MFRIGFRPLLAVLALVAAFALVAVESYAAPRMNAGSRGSRTYSAPPPTATTPNQARPMDRTMTQPGQPGAASAARPGTPAAQPGGLFNRPGLLGGLAAGFLGAGLIGLLMGNGLAGGLGGIASFLGLLLQIGIVVAVAMLLWRWWQRRSQPAEAMASVGGPAMRDAPANDGRHSMSLGGLGRFGGGASAQQPPAETPLELQGDDFNAFERLLSEIQVAYGSEDLNALRLRMTPEMLTYFADDLSQNASRGVVDKVSDVKLLQGDLSEAWREGNGDEYATVTMRYSLDERRLDRATGRQIEGGPAEITEYWTFRRASGGQWLLSAIQQTD